MKKKYKNDSVDITMKLLVLAWVKLTISCQYTRYHTDIIHSDCIIRWLFIKIFIHIIFQSLLFCTHFYRICCQKICLFLFQFNNIFFLSLNTDTFICMQTYAKCCIGDTFTYLYKWMFNIIFNVLLLVNKNWKRNIHT